MEDGEWRMDDASVFPRPFSILPLSAPALCHLILRHQHLQQPPHLVTITPLRRSDQGIHFDFGYFDPSTGSGHRWAQYRFQIADFEPIPRLLCLPSSPSPLYGVNWAMAIMMVRMVPNRAMEPISHRVCTSIRSDI